MDSISVFSGVGGLDLGLRRPVVEVTLICVLLSLCVMNAIKVCEPKCFPCSAAVLLS